MLFIYINVLSYITWNMVCIGEGKDTMDVHETSKCINVSVEYVCSSHIGGMPEI